MSVTPRDQALQILTTKHMKNLLEHLFHRYRVRLPITPEMTDEEVFDTGYVVLVNVLVDAWSAKLRHPNVFQLLDVAPIVAKIKKWRRSTGDNVYHTICSKFDTLTIRMIFEKLGKELFREPNDYGTYPIFSILVNTHPNVQEHGIETFLESLTSNELDLAQLVLLKDELFRGISSNRLPRYRQFKKAAINVIAKHDLFTDEDRKKVLALFRPPATGQPGINKLIMHAVTVMKFSAEDLEHIYNVLFANPSLLHYITNGTPEFIHFLLSNKPQEIRTLANSFETFIQDVFAKMIAKEAYEPLFFKALQLYEPSTFQPLPEAIEKRNSYAMRIVMLMLKHLHDIPKQYLNLLSPFKDSWIRNRLKNLEEEPQPKFPIEDLPVEMIVYLIGFCSHQSAVALSLANKQFYEYINNPTVWSNLYSKYFPLKPVPENQFNAGNNPSKVFYKYYNTKFGTPHRIERLPVIAPTPAGFTSLELKEDTLVYCSTHNVGVINLNKPVAVVTTVNKPSSARVLNDIVFVYTSNAIKMLAKDSLSTLRFFETPVPATIKDTFAVNEHALVTPRCVYDWRTGHLMSTWEERLEHVILRDKVYYGLSTTGLVIKDIRQGDNMTRVETDVPSLGQVSLNAYGNYLYIAGNQIETYDLRYLRRMTVSPFTTKIDEPKVIDLVSMNVWTSTLVWDLIDNKWQQLLDFDMAKVVTSQLAVCNGKEIICPGDRSLHRIHLPNDTYFPYGDFKSQYLASLYNGHDYGFI